MSSKESVTEWLNQLKQGESQAAQKLWQRYVERLVGPEDFEARIFEIGFCWL